MGSDFCRPWLNTPDRTTQYLPRELEAEIDPKLLKLIQTYGAAFDDDWYYWLARPNKKGKYRYIKRVPVWLGQKRMPTERWKRYFPHKQQKLIFALLEGEQKP